MPAGGTFRLIMRNGPTPDRVIELTRDVITFGRDVGNDVVINDVEISRHHARLTRQGYGYVLEDLGSTNGSSVNGRRITTAQPLHGGDLIGFGETVTLIIEYPMEGAADTIMAGGRPAAGPPTARATVREAVPPPPLERMAPTPPPPASPAFPPPPLEMESEPVQRSNTGRWILAGCGCLFVLACVGLAIFLWNAPCEFYESIGVMELLNLGPCPVGFRLLPIGQILL